MVAAMVLYLKCRDDKLVGHGEGGLDDIIDGVDVAPRLKRGIGSGLDHIEVDTCQSGQSMDGWCGNTAGLSKPVMKGYQRYNLGREQKRAFACILYAKWMCAKLSYAASA